MDKQENGQTREFLGGDVGFISLPYILEMFWKVFCFVFFFCKCPVGWRFGVIVSLND